MKVYGNNHSSDPVTIPDTYDNQRIKCIDKGVVSQNEAMIFLQVFLRYLITKMRTGSQYGS